MEWHAESTTQAAPLDANAAQVAITFDLQTQGALDPERLQTSLMERKQALRAEIFRTVAENILPGIVKHMEPPLALPENKIRVN